MSLACLKFSSYFAFIFYVSGVSYRRTNIDRRFDRGSRKSEMADAEPKHHKPLTQRFVEPQSLWFPTTS